MFMFGFKIKMGEKGKKSKINDEKNKNRERTLNSGKLYDE